MIPLEYLKGSIGNPIIFLIIILLFLSEGAR